MRSNVGGATLATRNAAFPSAGSTIRFRFVSGNPLIPAWAGPYGGVPPWDRMAPEHFPGAFDAGIAEQRREIDAIAANQEPPTFDNTIAAMERAGRMLDRLERMFAVARESVTTPAYQSLERE